MDTATNRGPRKEQILLRRPVQSDKEERLALGRHAEIVRMFGGSINQEGRLTAEQVDAWYDEITSYPHSWIIEYRGRCIGHARLRVEGGTAWYAVGILDPELLGKGLGRQITNLVLRYGFRTLALVEVKLRVLEFNTRAIHSYEACGFTHESLDKDSVFIEGTWFDDVIMTITKEKWEAAQAD